MFASTASTPQTATGSSVQQGHTKPAPAPSAKKEVCFNAPFTDTKSQFGSFSTWYIACIGVAFSSNVSSQTTPVLKQWWVTLALCSLGNPQRACAARVTVLVPCVCVCVCVCLSVCLSVCLFPLICNPRLQGGQTAIPTASVHVRVHFTPNLYACAFMRNYGCVYACIE